MNSYPTQKLQTPDTATRAATSPDSLSQAALVCPNCGAKLEGRKCKLLCVRAGCGYLVTCSEW